jgi:hypothetical protein
LFDAFVEDLLASLHPVPEVLRDDTKFRRRRTNDLRGGVWEGGALLAIAGLTVSILAEFPQRGGDALEALPVPDNHADIAFVVKNPGSTFAIAVDGGNTAKRTLLLGKCVGSC